MNYFIYLFFLQTHYLQPVDEMFMFLNYLALGSKQHDVAERCGVRHYTVSHIIATFCALCSRALDGGENRGAAEFIVII